MWHNQHISIMYPIRSMTETSPHTPVFHSLRSPPHPGILRSTVQSSELREKYTTAVEWLLWKWTSGAHTPISFHLYNGVLSIRDIHGGSEPEIRKELLYILEQTQAKTIMFDPHIDTTKKRILANLLTKNHPLIEVVRLLPGNDVLNVSFAGIKKLNDTYGQSFVDTLLAASKNRMMQSINTYIQQWEIWAEHIRIVRDDYKNLTLSLPPGTDAPPMLFGSIETKEDYMQKLICDVHTDIEDLARRYNLDGQMIIKDILENWTFGIGKSRVEIGAGNEQKLYAFGEAELVSRDNIRDQRISVMTFEASRPIRFGNECVRQERDIIHKWDTKTFVFDGISYPIITSINDRKRIHPELLRQVRKNSVEARIHPIQLVKEVKMYIDALNTGFDFIPPAHNLDQDLLAAQKMSDDFWKWRIRSESLLVNFKWVMAKEAFMQTIEKRLWMRLFIDIKDMWLQNLQSFQFLSRKTATMKADSRDMLSAWKEVTDNFMVLIKKIRESHPEAEITLGWDEVYIFLPGVTEKESTKTLASIHTKLDMSHLEWRVSSSFETGESEKIFKKLDESTVLHKMVEKMLHQGRASRAQRKLGHETISLELWPDIHGSDMAQYLNHPALQKALIQILEWVLEERWPLPQKIALPDEKQLSLRHDDGILHFICTKKP